jgi:TonB family protein
VPLCVKARVVTRVALALLVFLPLGAWAQADGGATGVLTKAPSLLQQVEAEFPPSMLDAGTGGAVVMDVDVGPDGKVMDAKVVESAGADFDAAALAAVKQFLFSPAEVDGQPAAVRLRYTYTFFFKPVVEQKPLEPLDAGGPLGVVNFSGTLVERGTREPIAGAQVVVGEGDAALIAVSDDKGAFELKDVPTGKQKVTAVSPDHVKYEETEDIVPGRRTEVTYFLRRRVYGGFETVVRGQKEKKEVAQVTLSREEIRLIPGTNGDAFRVVQNLPGVARTPYGIGFLVVRGGKPWDTKTYIDETSVPVLFHFGGLFSTYNSNLLDDLSFAAGNFDADYGRSIGGLVKATVRTPSQSGVHGYFDVNLVDASALVEAPLGNDWSFALSGRRSYIDVDLPAVLKLIPGASDAISFTVAPRYFDYQARVEWKPKGTKKRFFVNLFGSSDVLVAALPNPALDPEGRGSFGTSIWYNRLLVGYDTPLSERVAFRTRTTLGFDDVSFDVGEDIFARSKQFPVQSRNTFTIDLPEARTVLETGVDWYTLPYVVDAQSPELVKLNQIPDPFASRRLETEHSQTVMHQPALFANAIVKPLESVRVVAGARADWNSVMKKAWFDPRLSAHWQLNERVAFKGALGLYHQPPDYRQGQLSPNFGNPDLLPEGARQYMIGTEAHFTDALSLDVQLYYKDLFDQTRSTLGQNGTGDLATSFDDVRYRSIGKGRSYGAEILLRHALTRNFFGWVSYSLSRTERDYNEGKTWGLSPFDQPHNLTVVASYKLPHDWIAGVRLRYVSGALTTPYVGAIYDANANYYFPLPGAFFSRRLPDFVQLDVRIDKRFVYKEWMLAVYLDLQNATNRANVESVLYSFDYSQQAYLTGLPILPVLGVRGEW